MRQIGSDRSAKDNRKWALEKCLLRVNESGIKNRKTNFQAKMKGPAICCGKSLDVDFSLDSLIENYIMVELIALQEIKKVFEVRLFTCMKLLKCKKEL